MTHICALTKKNCTLASECSLKIYFFSLQVTQVVLINEPEVVLNDAGIRHELHVQVSGIGDLDPRVAVFVNEANHTPSGVREDNLCKVSEIQTSPDTSRRTSSDAPMPAMPMTA